MGEHLGELYHVLGGGEEAGGSAGIDLVRGGEFELFGSYVLCLAEGGSVGGVGLRHAGDHVGRGLESCVAHFKGVEDVFAEELVEGDIGGDFQAGCGDVYGGIGVGEGCLGRGGEMGFLGCFSCGFAEGDAALYYVDVGSCKTGHMGHAVFYCDLVGEVLEFGEVFGYGIVQG